MFEIETSKIDPQNYLIFNYGRTIVTNFSS